MAEPVLGVDGKPIVTPDKTFTQADIDKAVADAKAPFKDFDKIKSDAEEYGRVAQNPRFASFIEQENKRLALGDEEYNRLYGDQKQLTKDDDDDTDEDDDKMTPRERELKERLDRIEREKAEEKVETEKQKIANEYKEVSTNKEKFPLFDKTIKTKEGDEVPVRELMIRELDKAAKAGEKLTFAQAYREVTYDYQRVLGVEEAEAALAKKREAAKIGIPVSSPGRKSSNSADAPKTPREAAERVLAEFGM